MNARWGRGWSGSGCLAAAGCGGGGVHGLSWSAACCWAVLAETAIGPVFIPVHVENTTVLGTLHNSTYKQKVVTAVR